MLLSELMRIKAEGDYDAIKGAGGEVRGPLRSQAARPGCGAFIPGSISRLTGPE